MEQSTCIETFKKEAELTGLFNKDYYTEKNSDLFLEKTDPFFHYYTEGWKEFRNPSENFNTWWYVTNHLYNKSETSNPIEHYLTIGKSIGLSKTKQIEKKLNANEKTKYNKISLELFDSINPTATTAGRIAQANEFLEQDDLASTFYGKATELEPNNIALLTSHAKLYIRCKIWLRLKITMERIVKLANKNAEHQYMLALAYQNMENFGKATIAYKEAIGLNKNSPAEWYYNLGICEENSNNFESAEATYSRALELSDTIDTDLGVGAMHEKHSKWSEAATAYKKEIDKGINNSKLLFRYSLMLDYTYQWNEAVEAYKRALKSDKKNAHIYYRLGYVLEKLNNYPCSIIAYEKACELSNSHQNNWNYRLGYVLHQNHQYEDACNAWLKSLTNVDCTAHKKPNNSIEELKTILEQDRQDPDIHFNLGLAYYKIGEYSFAAAAFSEAAARRNDYNALDYFFWGKALMQIGDYKQAALALRETQIYKQPFDLPIDKENDIKKEYAEYISTLAVCEDTVLYETYFGDRITCNPNAIFKYLINNCKYKNLLHIWVVKPSTIIPNEFKHKKNVIFVRRDSNLYIRYLASSKYLINNTTFPAYFLRRKEQNYLNTWHGTPLKTLGADIRNNSFDFKNVTRNLLQTTHLIFPNTHTSSIILNKNQINEIYSGKIKITGMPRIDLTLNINQKNKISLIKNLGVDKNKPVLLYAPTWREEQGSSVFDTEKLENDIKKLKELPINLIFKGHHFTEKIIKNLNLNVTLPSNDIDTNELLSIVDILVTDYSSIFFDFIPLQKPIIFYTYDLNEYINERGLYFNINDMPGTVLYDIIDLKKEISNILANKWKKPINLDDNMNLFCPFEDGKSTERAVDFFINENKICKKTTSKQNILFYVGPFIPNGIITAFNNLISLLPKDNFSISIALDPWVMESYPQRMQRFSKLKQHSNNKNINILPRLSFSVSTEEESWLEVWHNKMKGKTSYNVIDIITKSYQREFSRLYGEAKFDYIIHYEGYNSFWFKLFSLGKPKNTTGYLWLHSDMHSEIKLRFPNMQSNYRLAEQFDCLVSVSSDTNNINKKNLSELFNIPASKFTWVDNCINHQEIIKLSKQKLQKNIIEWARGAILIGGIGRLSPEKAFDRLIEAFSMINQEHPETKLIIAGQGPEDKNLKDLVKHFKLQNNVYFTGFIENPYPLFKKLDLFVLSSDHEGLATVALESLVLGCPLICSDIPGTPEIIKKNKELLFKPTVNGVYQGIKSFLEGNLPVIQFNPYEFNKNSLEQFSTLITNQTQSKQDTIYKDCE